MKQTKLFLPLLISIILTANQSVRSQIIINEFSCSNLSQYVDDHSDYNDWIELYNTTGSTINMAGYYLGDDSINFQKWQFPATASIAAYGYLRIWASGRNQLTSPFHTNFSLKQTKGTNEWIIFSNAVGTWIDSKEIQKKSQLGHSYGRVPNAGASWGIYSTPTPNAANTTTPYIKYADKPDFSVPAGFYTSAQTVIITTTEPNSEIRYTTDGSLPTATSTLYTAPVAISTTKVLKAITRSTDPTILTSFIEYETYFINVSHTVPVVSIAATQLTTLANGSGSLVPFGSFEYFENQIKTTESYGEFNKHGQDSWANSQRSLDFVGRDEMGYNWAVEDTLFNTTLMDKFQRIILRASGDDNYPADHHTANLGSAHVRDAYIHSLSLEDGLDVDVRRASKCVVYLNNSYWGVYDLRDNPDNHDNIEFYYGQNKYNIYMRKRWGSAWSEYGGTAATSDWASVYNYVMANNMATPANWNWVNDRLDVYSLVDYVLINMFTVCSDWLNWNTCWWRGLDSAGTHLKWGYQLWDNDATFGHYINYTGIPNTTPTAEPCDPEGLNGSSDPDDHIGLLLKLRQNPDFNQYYLTRQLDLWNTTFSCDNMMPYLDSMVAVIDPEMTAHASRWFGTYTEWDTNVQILRDFITQRCTAITAGFISCYSYTGPYNLTINADPAGAGSIKLNSLVHSVLPWSGTYFGGVDNKLVAMANPFYLFVLWSANNQTFNPNAGVTNVKVNLTSTDSIVAHFLVTSVPELLPIVNPIVSAYPTVTNSQVTVQYSLPEASPVTLKIYSVLGTQIAEINSPDSEVSAGNHVAVIDFAKANIPGGMYILEFCTPAFKQSIKLLYTAN